MGLKPVKVSQVNKYIARVLSGDPLLGNISVIGEIANLNYHNSGHVYFSLRDERSRINCFLPSYVLPEISFRMEDGMEVIVSGSVSLYERGGYYSINVRQIEQSGQGDLAVAFEQLKRKLLQEGLFDPSLKKPIPVFPRKIAVVTSETGAAIRDILKIIKRKNNITDILICPVLVQGPGAAPEIAAMLDHINCEHKDVDTIIVGRGGGSLEDLWAFNEEIVARAIFRSEIPIISAVGHETDFTISDMAADLRAETPTAAADLAVPDTDQLRIYLTELKDHLDHGIAVRLDNAENAVRRLDLSVFGSLILKRLENTALVTECLRERIRDGMDLRLKQKATELEMMKNHLDHLSPYQTMARGYAAITDPRGNFIAGADELKENDDILLHGIKTVASARVKGVREK